MTNCLKIIRLKYHKWNFISFVKRKISYDQKLIYRILSKIASCLFLRDAYFRGDAF